MSIPNCSTWEVWMGKEIEGDSELGMLTLFIRINLSLKEFEKHFAAYSLKCVEIGQTEYRIWFTKEFNSWGIVKEAMTIAHYVALEVDLDEMRCKGTRRLPQNMLAHLRLYVKLPIQLKKDDHICIGSAFSDEAFKIGTGRKVSPEDYNEDIQLQ